jgi:D-alanyl-D-alanine dipeptidase
MKSTMTRREMLRNSGAALAGLAGTFVLGGCAQQATQAAATPPATTTASDGRTESTDASDFVLIADVVPDVILEVRYFGTYNFVGERIDGYEEPIAITCKESAEALKRASDDAIARGYRLKIWDAYRPQRAVNHFERWAEDLGDTRMKQYFYPELDKSVLFDQGYIDHRSGHSRGAAIDLTLFDMNLERDVDMGGTFDYFGELSHPDYRATITDEQYNNRMILRDIMVNAGFDPLATEWWHFKLANEPFPNTFFDFPVATGSVARV